MDFGCSCHPHGACFWQFGQTQTSVASWRPFFRALAVLFISLLKWSRWFLAFLRPLLVYRPVFCYLLHALNTLLGETPNILARVTYGCVILEEVHYLNNFCGVQKRPHMTTSGEEKCNPWKTARGTWSGHEVAKPFLELGFRTNSDSFLVFSPINNVRWNSFTIIIISRPGSVTHLHRVTL